MKPQSILVLLVLVVLALHCKENEAVSFPWSCASLSGVCRQGVCLPSELYFGPLGCVISLELCKSQWSLQTRSVSAFRAILWTLRLWQGIFVLCITFSLRTENYVPQKSTM
uniref:Defensin, beta-like 1 n=1 Tax=Cyprinus carpio carpio TaxID=630221 RepID=A0A8C1DCC9_CYPCA